MLRQIWGRSATPTPRHILREVVAKAYQDAREPECCDPRDLIDGLGVRPCPTRTEVAFISDGLLHYPEDAPLATRGLAIYRLTAKMIWPRGNYLPVMTELILPELTAKTTPFCDLWRVQPHAPLGLVQAIYMTHGRSGVIPIPRIPRPT